MLNMGFFQPGKELDNSWSKKNAIVKAPKEPGRSK